MFRDINLFSRVFEAYIIYLFVSLTEHNNSKKYTGTPQNNPSSLLCPFSIYKIALA